MAISYPRCLDLLLRLGALVLCSSFGRAAGLSVPSQTLALANDTAGGHLGGLPAPVDDAGHPYLVRLRREVFPVRRKGKVVSFKASYSGVINVGRPVPQEFRVVFDTGSGHVVLPSVECRTDTCMKHRRYSMQKSSTAVAVNLDGSPVSNVNFLGDQVTIGFGTGKVVGEFVRDVVCLGPTPEGLVGDAETKGPCVDAQVVMAIDMSRRPFELFDFDGILGLGLGSLALSSNFSFFGLLAGSGQMSHPHFGVFLADTDSGEDSEIAIGGHNPARLREPLSWVPMVKPQLGYWQVEILAVYIDGQKLDICSSTTCTGILDTGTSHLGVPAVHNDQVYEMLTQEADKDVTDCRYTKAPVVRIELREFNLTLNPENYMRKLPLAEDLSVDRAIGVTPTSYKEDEASRSRPPTEVVKASSAGNPSSELKHYCTPKLLPVNLSATIGGHVFILGEPALQRYYTVYDWGGLRAGFGLAAHHNGERDRPKLGAGQGTADSSPHLQDNLVLLQVVLVVRPGAGARRPGSGVPRLA